MEWYTNSTKRCSRYTVPWLEQHHPIAMPLSQVRPVDAGVTRGDADTDPHRLAVRVPAASSQIHFVGVEAVIDRMSFSCHFTGRVGNNSSESRVWMSG